MQPTTKIRVFDFEPSLSQLKSLYFFFDKIFKFGYLQPFIFQIIFLKLNVFNFHFTKSNGKENIAIEKLYSKTAMLDLTNFLDKSI
jgi:hypothetical protein